MFIFPKLLGRFNKAHYIVYRAFSTTGQPSDCIKLFLRRVRPMQAHIPSTNGIYYIVKNRKAIIYLVT